MEKFYGLEQYKSGNTKAVLRSYENIWLEEGPLGILEKKLPLLEIHMSEKKPKKFCKWKLWKFLSMKFR